MLYYDLKGDKLSCLGLGCMRLPNTGDYNEIDEVKTAEMVDYAIKNGVNYFDTAYIYHGGNSEKVMGKILKKYPRESYYLISKFPGFDLKYIDKVEEVFEDQLKKCDTEYFDYYLFHNVCEVNIEQYLDPKYRIYDYLVEQKKKGKIRRLAFSTHGTLETMKRFLDAYAKDMDFCQIQLNWLDWDLQDAKTKVELVKSYGLPIVVMEPLRGGSLCRLAPKYKQILTDLSPERSLAEWGFRYLQSIGGIAVILSGMSNFKQMAENIEIFKENKPLNDKELKALADISYEMTHKKTLPCTACRYCTEKCPKELDIPHLISLYNEHDYSDGGYIAQKDLEKIAEDKKPTACIGCRACEKACPQNIKISEVMKDFAMKL